MMLGNNIRIARKRMGLTQEELAMQIGVTAQGVSRWESEAGLPDTSLIVPLVQALQISTDTLFGMDQMKQEDAMYMEIKREYEKIESDEKTPADAAKKECEYIAGRLEVNPSDFVLATCMVERVANLSRYVVKKDLLRGRIHLGQIPQEGDSVCRSGDSVLSENRMGGTCTLCSRVGVYS